MLKCQKCNSLLENDSVVCPYCGSNELINETKEKEVKKGPWNKLASISKIFGILSIVFCFIEGTFFGPVAIVLGSLGKNCTEAKYKKKARVGVRLGILGTILGLISCIIIFVIGFMLSNGE